MVEKRGMINREGFERTIKGMHEVSKGIHLLRIAHLGNEGGWTGAEGVCEFLMPLLLPEEKSRIVIEYDPTKDKIAAYRETTDTLEVLDDYSNMTTVGDDRA